MNIVWANTDIMKRCGGYWGAKMLLHKMPIGATHVSSEPTLTYSKITNGSLYQWIDGEWIQKNLRVVPIQSVINMSINLLKLEKRILDIEDQLTGIETIGWNDQVISPMDACVWVNERHHGNDYLIYPIYFFDLESGGKRKNYFARCIQPQIDFYPGTWSANGLRKVFPEEITHGRRIFKTAKDVHSRIQKAAFFDSYNKNPFL